MQPLISKDFTTGAFTPIFNLRAHDASWSHDGKQLAYAQYGELFVRSADGSTRLVASVKGLLYWLRWSPDDRRLRFSENYDGDHDRIWQVDGSGANLHPLFAQQADKDRVCCGSWTPSGRAFLYLSNEFHSSSIHVRPESSGVVDRLLRWVKWDRQQSSIDIPAAPLDTWGAPAPGLDGKHVYAVGEQLRGKLVRIDPATRKPEPYLGGISAEGVSFSPDHSELVWTAYPEGTLWRSRIDGTHRMQLTQGPLIARFPHWSPDGGTIVFIAARPGLDWQLYTVPANGPASGGQAKLLLQESIGQGVATWSPDGKALAFGHILDLSQARIRAFAIETYRLSGGKASILPESSGLWTARWSPDGRYLSAVTRDNQTLKLYNMQTGTWSDLAKGSINDVVWTLDSKYLFFDTAFGSKPVLYRVRISNRKLESFANLENIRRAGFFAPWVGVAPDGAPILLEDTSIEELYSIAVNLP